MSFDTKIYDADERVKKSTKQIIRLKVWAGRRTGKIFR